MLLALDIGNTSIHIGLWDGQRLAATWRIGVETEKLPDEYGVLFTSLLATRGFERRDVDACIIGCDVPPLLPTMQAVSREYFGVEPLVVGHGLR
ncbi:MAG: type III pantothenate kinase, partial [Dehalococcoidia bacterium]|nr:type III pantothenate kinase [Dehalococcoidia bacterium]